MINVVYDSPEALPAAEELLEGIEERGKKAELMDAHTYAAEVKSRRAGKTVVLGHGALAQKVLDKVSSVKYDEDGMTIASKGSFYVLSADSSFAPAMQEMLSSEPTISDLIDEMKVNSYDSGDEKFAKVATSIIVAPFLLLVSPIYFYAKHEHKRNVAITHRNVLHEQYSTLAREFISRHMTRFLYEEDGRKLAARLVVPNGTGKAAEKPRSKAAAGKKAGSPAKLSGLQELDGLVGLESVKKTVREIVTYLQKRGSDAVPCLHMVFRGNPGTAKTTVARIIAQIFAQAGITEKDVFVETDRSGLIAGYVGQTATKTEERIDEAMGGVLFIDEAYSLYTSGGQDYGNECIATLVKEMENKRDRFVCIMAGYTEEMNDMIKMNPGLRDRIQFYLDFPDYTEKELLLIFESFCAKKGYTLAHGARKALTDIFSSLPRAKAQDFSNGRLVRKLFERVCIKQAQRSDDVTITEKDIKAALAEPDIEKMCKGSRKPIGFTGV